MGRLVSGQSRGRYLRQNPAGIFPVTAQPVGVRCPGRWAAGADDIPPLLTDAPCLLESILSPNLFRALFDNLKNARIAENTHCFAEYLAKFGHVVSIALERRFRLQAVELQPRDVRQSGFNPT